MDLIGMFACGACAALYPTQREADLCTPEYKIAERYGASA